MDTYYMRNRERILQRSTKAYREEKERIAQYQRDYLYKAKWREEHRDETREKSREDYADKVMEEEGRAVVPTLKRAACWYMNKPNGMSDTEYRRAKIARRLEINEQRAEQFKKLLSGENV
jgi:antirestriction protein ArdC